MEQKDLRISVNKDDINYRQKKIYKINLKHSKFSDSNFNKLIMNLQNKFLISFFCTKNLKHHRGGFFFLKNFS